MLVTKEVIGIIGTIAAGKDTAGNHISDVLHIPSFQISSPLKEIGAENGVEPTRDNLIALGTHLPVEHGDGYLAEYILERMLDRAVITGMRQLGQIAVFLDKVEGMMHARLNMEHFPEQIPTPAPLDSQIEDELNSLPRRRFALRIGQWTLAVESGAGETQPNQDADPLQGESLQGVLIRSRLANLKTGTHKRDNPANRKFTKVAGSSEIAIGAALREDFNPRR